MLIQVIQVVKVFQLIQVVRVVGVDFSGRVVHVVQPSVGSGDPGFQVVQVVRMISLDDMQSENILFSSEKPSNY